MGMDEPTTIDVIGCRIMIASRRVRIDTQQQGDQRIIWRVRTNPSLADVPQCCTMVSQDRVWAQESERSDTS